jgi:hypothetical protein
MLTKLAELALFLNQNSNRNEQESELYKEQKLRLKTFLNGKTKDLEYKKLKRQRFLIMELPMF